MNFLSLLKNPEQLYNDQVVSEIQNRIENINQEMTRIKESIQGDDIPTTISINYILLTFYKNRCKRILRAYHFQRLLNLKNFFILNEKEKKLHKSIKEIENEYLSCFDLNYEGKVPLLSFIKIMTLKDCGLVYDGDELVDLKKGRIYFIKRKAIEHLLEGGYLKIV
ncbi:hypothetical protein NBO_508g0032 [Nosema bombycis CQ1]|uniref:DNA replication complex GINS protein SLD5 n=1 Tax=Nosema bombycis (strain CQ1 / CVCC 102059) TaxID=578461 RepID=R0KND5_NOSB1|nr:hypothetical protein NBO_508g0032 [Nosema bombycis CQ1]|eukprot:EOB12181.1 hypothetical protein NBO_508g0032 [Nosema bombycis CQ1]